MMKLERLGNKIIQVRGISYKPNDISAIPLPDYVPVLKANNIQEEGIDTNNLIYIHKNKVKPEQFIKKGDLLLAASSGSKEIVGKNIYFESDFNGSFGAFCKLVRPKNHINPRYLATFFKSVPYKRHIRKLLSGALINNLKNEYIDSLLIPEVSDADQLHIANLLSQAENLISRRNESIRLLDEFLKSTFLEMFGDPVRNEKGWEINSLAEFGSFKNGLNYARNETGVSVRCLGVGDFKKLSKLSDIESLAVLNLTSEPSNDYYLKDGDIVFVRSNGNRELVGRCIIIFPKSEKVTYSGFCIRYRIEKNGINSTFLSHLFRVPVFRKSMLQGGRGANIQNINQQTLAGLKIPTPNLSLQAQFAHIVEKTEALKAQYQQSLQELENLYGSLSQRVFLGELGVKDEEFLMAAEQNARYKRL